MIYFFIEDSNEKVKIGRARTSSAAEKVFKPGIRGSFYFWGGFVQMMTCSWRRRSIRTSLTFVVLANGSIWILRTSCRSSSISASMVLSVRPTILSKSSVMIGMACPSISASGVGATWNGTSAALSAEASAACTFKTRRVCTTA